MSSVVGPLIQHILIIPLCVFSCVVQLVSFPTVFVHSFAVEERVFIVCPPSLRVRFFAGSSTSFASS
jgi:hypothetical protein